MEHGVQPLQVPGLRVSASTKAVFFSYSLHDQVLEVVSRARYVGVDISSGLSWSSRIDRINAKANSTLGFVKRNIKP